MRRTRRHSLQQSHEVLCQVSGTGTQIGMQAQHGLIQLTGLISLDPLHPCQQHQLKQSRLKIAYYEFEQAASDGHRSRACLVRSAARTIRQTRKHPAYQVLHSPPRSYVPGATVFEQPPQAVKLGTCQLDGPPGCCLDEPTQIIGAAKPAKPTPRFPGERISCPTHRHGDERWDDRGVEQPVEHHRRLSANSSARRARCRRCAGWWTLVTMTEHGDQNDEGASSPPERPPACEVIADAIRQRIESGELHAGRPLPTDLQLREQYQASRKTIDDAIGLLVDDGLVEVIPDQEPIVSQVVNPLVLHLNMASASLGDQFTPHPDNLTEDRRHIISGPTIEIQSATDIVASELHLEEGSKIVIRHHSHFIESTPWSQRSYFFPWWLVEQGATALLQAAPLYSGVCAYLQDELRIQRADRRAMMIARLANEDEASFFNLRGDRRKVPIIEIRATEIDDKNRPFGMNIATYPADRNRFMF
jgi:GntR family transcriptional regulator